MKYGRDNGNYKDGRCSTYKLEGNSYRAMIARCYYKRYRAYHRYGGRGIKVCDRWLGEDGFRNFLSDMGTKPSTKHSLDRIDNDSGYSPENCRWSTQESQVSNSSTIKLVEIDGVSKPIKEWFKIFDISRHTYYSRVYSGWDPVRAIKTTVNKSYRNKRFD